MNTTTTTRTLRLGLAAAAIAFAMPTGTAAAAGEPGPAEYGVIETQCEADRGTFFVNTYDGLNLICSGPEFHAAGMPAQITCDRIGGAFRLIGREQPASWSCHVPGAG